ncbi:MAG: sugar nucleotide-binding protein [Planctomycetota bacterium]
MILLLGASGYVGSAFVRHLNARRIDFRPVARRRVDYYNVDHLVQVIRESKASFLINCAGYTGKPNVDVCEAHKHECLMGNAVLPGVIREACDLCRLPWGHVSSGCIYQGERPGGGGFKEDDVPNFCFRTDNCSFYSGCKALGEECLAGADNVYSWRMRIPFSHIDSDRNYLSKLMRYDRLLDVTNSISNMDEFVEACLQSWENRIPFGTYNITNTGAITTREVTDVIKRYLMPDKQYLFFKDEAEFMEQVAGTPRSSCVLDNSKILNSGIQMSDILTALERSLANWIPRENQS